MEFIDCIRDEMKTKGYDLFLLKDCDPHLSEYVNDYYKFRSVASNFKGSNGLLAVGLEEACLFTDGRYFIQAEKELSGGSIKLMKLSTPGYPTIREYVRGFADKGKTVACPSDIFSYKECLNYGINALDDKNYVFLNAYKKYFNKDYPDLKADDTVSILSDDLTGESCESKVLKVQKTLSDTDADFYLSAVLDSNMWICNIRGKAIRYNPVALSYVMITKDEAFLFLFKNSDTSDDVFDEIKNELKKQGISVALYEEFESVLRGLPDNKKACFLFDKMPVKYANILNEKNYDLINSDCKVSMMKSIKNETEINNLREAYRKDNKVVKDFIEWIGNNDVTSLKEYDLMVKLDEMRLSEEDCYDLSFDTISASGPNAAMMHYESYKDDCSAILDNSLYLVDSGGQWKGGTTDITRTVAIGIPTYEMKHDYTRVARGMLALMNAVFIEGCTGINLDILAREPMWEEGDDYKCGTGHGVGYMLSVHEGPQAIRWIQGAYGRDAVLKPGMLVSDEPGIYKEGRYGIRIENILLVKEKYETADGKFFCFECLTYVPLDEKLLLRDEMTGREVKWLDDYQDKCKTLV
ncbi:MAG: aminopeptidase P family protein [Lachnospiraceae bacterium]|nr:aminopeptidase P family protein [Lachnospiraceae bacterium]